MTCKRTQFAVLIAAVVAVPAHAAVVISSDATSNMSCSAGTCVPTANKAVLNASDLENMLTTGNVTVTTSGSGVQANNIDVETPFSWSTQSVLALDAGTAISVEQEISVMGQSELSLTTNGETQSFSISRKGRIAFQNLSSALTINGISFTLVNTIASLADSIASNPSGSYALADNYDASQDGTYAAAPIQTVFTGTFDGLGNAISHLSINDESDTQTDIGLYYEVVGPGTVEHVHLARVKIVSGNKTVAFDRVGTLVGINASGYLFQDSSTGMVRFTGGQDGPAGGLTGANVGTVDTCVSEVTVEGMKTVAGAEAGGLVGENDGHIVNSFSTGSVKIGRRGRGGGLVGENFGLIENSYSNGAVAVGVSARAGGLVGLNNDQNVQAAYSTGAVSGGSASYVGGFAGSNTTGLTYTYWDIDTSGTNQAVGKGDKKRITGLTTEQLQSGLPSGFDPKVWGEKSSINNGLPYLLANPPQK